MGYIVVCGETPLPNKTNKHQHGDVKNNFSNSCNQQEHIHYLCILPRALFQIFLMLVCQCLRCHTLPIFYFYFFVRFHMYVGGKKKEGGAIFKKKNNFKALQDKNAPGNPALFCQQVVTYKQQGDPDSRGNTGLQACTQVIIGAADTKPTIASSFQLYWSYKMVNKEVFTNTPAEKVIEICFFL